MAGRKYPEPARDTWVQPIPNGYRLRCCDCGLVHVFNFRVRDGRVQFNVPARDERATGQIRRHLRKKRGGVVVR